MRGKSRSIMFPTVIVVVLITLPGCIQIPVMEGRWATHNQWEGVVGAPGSKAKIETGASTREDVRRLLGAGGPWFRDDGQPEPAVWQYERYNQRGWFIWLWPFVHGGPIQRMDRTHHLAIWFDGEGRVRGWEMWRTPPDYGAPHAFPTSAPATQSAESTDAAFVIRSKTESG